MLIIDQGPGGRIFIGGEIELCVSDTGGTTVRLGISARVTSRWRPSAHLGSNHADAGVDTRKMPVDGPGRD